MKRVFSVDNAAKLNSSRVGRNGMWYILYFLCFFFSSDCNSRDYFCRFCMFRLCCVGDSTTADDGVSWRWLQTGELGAHLFAMPAGSKVVCGGCESTEPLTSRVLLGRSHTRPDRNIGTSRILN